MLLRSSYRSLRRLAGLSAASLLLTNCTSQPENLGKNVLMHNGFDELAGWLGIAPQPTLTNEKAHSGRYSIKVDANNEYSISYTKPLGQLSEARVAKFKVDAWVWAPSANDKALLVSTFGETGSKPLSWVGFDVVKASPTYGQWTQVSEIIEVPATSTANTLFTIFLWRINATQPTYLDDLTISAVQ